MLAMKIIKGITALWLSAIFASASAQVETNSVPLGSNLRDALAKSSLTNNDPVPFHILIVISEPENVQSPYQAAIEEWWVSNDQWRREVTDKEGLDQTIVVANGKRTETDEGDYFPLWLRSFVTAAFDPIPEASSFNTSNATIDQITLANGAKSSPTARLQSKIGTGDRATDAFSNISFDSSGRLSFYGSPRYSMEFRDYRSFGNKQVPYEFVDNPEPGTRLVGKVFKLEEESKAKTTPGLFTPLPTSHNRFHSVIVDSQHLEQYTADNASIVWPTVHSGNTRGHLAVYIGVDDKGQVREAWPLNSDNAGLEDPTRDQVRKWKIKPVLDVSGNPTQADGGLGFNFETKVADPLPVLTSPADIARQIAGCTYKPVLTAGLLPSGQSFKIRVSVNEQGKRTGETFPPGVPWKVIQQTGIDFHRCQFLPYIANGGPTYYFIDFTFTAP